MLKLKKNRSNALRAGFLVYFLFILFFPCPGTGTGNSPASPDKPGEKKNNRNSEYEYSTDFSFVEVPDPLSGNNPLFPLKKMNVPEIGKPFKDNQFSTKLTRVTQIEGIKGRHEYSRFDPFNIDKSMILLLDPSGDYNVYKTGSMPYNSRENFVAKTNNIEDPRWDNDDPTRLWGLSDFQIVRDHVTTGTREVIKDFSTDPLIKPILDKEPDIYRVTMRQEGEASRDRRYWAFILQGTKDDYRARYIFCWDRKQDKVPGLYQVPAKESEIDWVGMSIKGNWVLIGGMEYNSGNLKGLTIANRQLTRFHRIDYTTSHADVGLDIDGNEIIVMQNSRTDYIDMIPLDVKTRPVLESGGSYEGTNRIPLVRLYYNSDSPVGFNAGVHISCNTPGYCVVSTYLNADNKAKNWLDRAQVLVRLDPKKPRVFYLAKVYNTHQSYWEETHATITGDGSRVVWATNWNRDIGGEKMFLMQLDMPSNWKTLLKAKKTISPQ
jgi:hypothetical protein